MPVHSTTDLQPYLSTLTPNQSARTLRQAAEHRATILLDSEDSPQVRELVTQISKIQDDTLTVELNVSPSSSELVCLKRKTCRARLLLSEQAYQFNTQITEIVEDNKSISLNLARPDQIEGEARRQFPRLRFAESSKVRLLWRDGEETREDIGTLCNVSTDGAAVLVECRTAEDLAVIDTAYIEFSLPCCPQPFRLPGYVKGITPGGEVGRAVLSLKFQDDASEEVQAQIAALKTFLGQYLGQSTKQEIKT